MELTGEDQNLLLSFNIYLVIISTNYIIKKKNSLGLMDELVRSFVFVMGFKRPCGITSVPLL